MDNKSIVEKNFIQYINGVVKNNKISHAYLIELDNYEDNFIDVMNFIKMIVCNKSYEEVLESNDPRIVQLDSGNYPDLYIVSSNTNVINKKLITDLQSEFKNKSLYGNKRIYVIKEAEKLNDSSANTILKFLEEPKDDIVAILLTDDRYHIIETVLSRCQILSLKEDKLIDFNDDELIDSLDYFLNPRQFFLKYGSCVKDLFNDKNDIISKFQKVEKVILFYLSNKSSNCDVNNLLSKYDKLLLINILSIIEEELPRLSFNLNTKLWLDSFFARLIGG